MGVQEPQKSSSAVARIYIYLKSKGVKKVGILSANDKFGQEGEALLKELAPDEGIKIVAQEQFGPEDADMSVQIGKIAAAKPQAMIVWAIGPGGAVAAKNARQLKVPFTIVQCHGQPDPTYLKLAGAAANGTIMPATKLMVAAQLPNSDPQKKVEIKFIAEYKSRGFGEVSTHSGYAWDAIQIIASAMRKAGTNPRETAHRDREHQKLCRRQRHLQHVPEGSLRVGQQFFGYDRGQERQVCAAEVEKAGSLRPIFSGRDSLKVMISFSGWRFPNRHPCSRRAGADSR